MFPRLSLALPRPFPLYAAFPRSEYCMGKSDFHRRICFPQNGSFGWHTRSAYCQTKTAVDLPGS